MTKGKVFIISLVAVLALALAATAAFAQDDGTDEATPDTEQTTPKVPFGLFGHHGLGGPEGDRDEYLAEALGIGIDELQAARLSAYGLRLGALVDEGLIDQDQADLMLAVETFKSTLDRDALVAQALGIGVDELEQAREDGQSLGDLLSASELTAEEYQAAYQAAYEQAVQDAVDEGILTETQAAEIENGAALGLRGFEGPGHGHGHGHGPGRGFDEGLEGSGMPGFFQNSAPSAPLTGSSA